MASMFKKITFLEHKYLMASMFNNKPCLNGKPCFASNRYFNDKTRLNL